MKSYLKQVQAQVKFSLFGEPPDAPFENMK